MTRPWQGELLPLLAASNPNPPLIFSIFPFPYKYKHSANTNTLLAASNPNPLLIFPIYPFPYKNKYSKNTIHYWQNPTPTQPLSFPPTHFLKNTNTVQIQIHYWLTGSIHPKPPLPFAIYPFSYKYKHSPIINIFLRAPRPQSLPQFMKETTHFPYLLA